MWDGSIGDKIALKEPRGMDEFNFTLGDVVLAEWEDKLFYAKIQKIDRVSGKCILIFDDDSVEECPFSKIHSVTETTAEIVCIICKDGTSLRPNEIVLCDKCGIGYHQHCHDPAIPATALEFDAPWMCVYCSIGAFCPYLENPFESKPAKKGEGKTRIHTLKTGETCVSSGNSTEDEKDLPRDTIKESELPSREMSSYYFSSHMHQRDGSKPRGRPAFGHKSKSTGEKRGRGTGRPSGRPGVRDRDQYPDRNSEFDVNQQRKSSQNFQRHGSDVSRHSGRYGSPVRRLGEDSEDIKLSPTRESRKYQQLDENKAAKVISHRRDAPREKQRLTQDLARQKRLLSEDIARAELLQREQLTKKFSDMFDNKKESLGTDRAVEMDDENVSKDNFNAEMCDDVEGDLSPSMYEQCYGDYSPEYNNEHAKDLSTHEENSDIVCKLPLERESLFDRFLRKESVQEMKSIEFVNESKVEVKGMRYKNNVLASPCSEGVKCEADNVTNCDATPELEPLKFENVTDDELTFSDGDQISTNEPKTNRGSPTFPKAVSPVENGLGSTTEAKCNGLEETCDLKDSPVKNDLYSKENMITNLGYESCECPSEDGNTNCDDKPTESNARSNERCVQADHSSIKSSKIARLMEEPDMQCEHSSKHKNDCELHDSEVSTCEINGESNSVYEINGAQSTDSTEKQRLEKKSKNKQTAGVAGNVESKSAEKNADVKEIQSSKLQEKESSQNNSCSAEQNSLENVANESELSNIEGMSDAGELSEPEAGTLVNRGKVKKRKRRKQKSNKSVHQSGLTNPRRKSKGNKVRSPVKDAKTTKRIKQLDSESDDDTLCNKRNESMDGKGLLKLVENQNTVAPNDLKDLRLPSPLSHAIDDKHDDNMVTEANGHAGKSDEKRSLSPNEEGVFVDGTIEEVIAMGTMGSDNCDSSQEANALSDTQKSAVEEDGKKEQGRKEKRIGKTKRKSEEKEKERERSTPPHLISQNRYARDLPRHNWLVERLLQQNKLCAEDTLQRARDTNDEQGKDENPAGDEQELPNSGDKENPVENVRSSPVEPTAEKSEVSASFSPKQQSDQEDPESPSSRDGFQNELHRSFLRRSFPPNVPKTMPRLKPSSSDTSGGSDSKPPPPPLKHTLTSKEPCSLEPLPKLRKIVDEKENANDPQETEELSVENQEIGEPGSSETEQPRKAISPIEILDDEDEKKKRGEEEKTTSDKTLLVNDEQTSSKFNETSQKDGEKSPVKSLSTSPSDKHSPFSSPKKPFGTVNATIPTNVRDKFGRPMHMPPHRAAILIPVVSMHDGSGIPISPGLGPASPHMKGYSPRTFTPHLLTHGAPVPGPGMFGNPLSQGGRYAAANCGHHMHGNMKSGIPCKRDVNCPFHGNNPRGMPPGILDIPGHHGPMHGFGHHSSHDHLSAVMCQSPPGRDALGDKQALQTPKVVKPIAHVPGKRTPLMLSHLQQIGKHSPASLRELEALHEDKARRYGADLLLSPHQLQTSPDRSPREQVVPNMSPLHDRRPLHQPLTLSDLNRRREEEMLKVKADEELKSKSLPGEFMTSSLPSVRGPAKFTTPPPHSKDPSLLSPGRGHRSSSMSPVDKREQVLSLRRLVEDREPGAIMNDFLKPGPPRLRPVDEADVRLSSERQRREELLLTRGHTSPFLRVSSAKDAAIHHGKVSEGVEIVGPRGIELVGQAGRVERERDVEGVRQKSSHGNSSIMNPGFRLLEDKRKQVEEARQTGNRDEQRVREHVSPEMERRFRLEQMEENKLRNRSSDLLQIKGKDPRIELRDKDGNRIPLSERERPEDLLLLRAGEGNSRSRMPLDMSPSLRHKMYPDRVFLPTGVPGRLDPRVDPRMVALHELEMHRRGEAIRASEPSHRELLSRMASSLPISKGGSPIGQSIFVRPDGSLERRGPDSSRLPSEVHMYSPPTSLPSREFGMMMNSRQAMERLAAAAGKPGPMLAEVGKDLPPHIRQDIERERERERQRMSLEQIEANRRLLHAELKDKVNPLVFSKEHQLRMEQKREHIDALRAREKRLADRERFMFMERIAEERKRRFSEMESHGGILIRHPSPPQFGSVADRDEYERVKRLKLSEPSVSSPGSVQHSKHLSSSLLHSERKEPQVPNPKNHIMTSSQVREKSNEQSDARISRPRENELVRKSSNSAMFERDPVWHRNREQAARAHGGIEHKRSGLHPGPSLHGFMPPKGGPRISQREEGKGSGKPDGDGVNRCSVCKRDASFLCSGCQAAWYCSSECQLSAWGTHNRECSQNKRQ